MLPALVLGECPFDSFLDLHCLAPHPLHKALLFFHFVLLGLQLPLGLVTALLLRFLHPTFKSMPLSEESRVF